jgi:hypothetical protein
MKSAVAPRKVQAMVRSSRLEFSEETKSDAFARDKAMCCYTGKSLWMADYGMDPDASADWLDHLVPASKGGSNDIGNALTTSWLWNKWRGAGEQMPALFFAGVPTFAGEWALGEKVMVFFDGVQRMEKLDPSDWWLNRALWNTFIATQNELLRRSGTVRKRGPDYWARAALRMLDEWRKRAARDGVKPPEKRKLQPTVKDRDVQLLWDVRRIETEAALLERINELAVWLEAHQTLMTTVRNAKAGELAALFDSTPKNKAIAPRIKVKAQILIGVRGSSQEGAHYYDLLRDGRFSFDLDDTAFEDVAE